MIEKSEIPASKPGARAYVEHVAIAVRDLDWHAHFFAEVFEMHVKAVDVDAEGTRRQCWTLGGLQLVASAAGDDVAGPVVHLGIMCEDRERAIERAQALGAMLLAQGSNWLRLPEGLVIELLEARNDAVAAVLAIDPRSA